MTAVPAFDYELAESLDAALLAMSQGALPMHGGTELLPAMGLGLFAPERVVSLRAIDDLRRCVRDGDDLILGAGLTHHEVATSDLVVAGAPLLAEVTSGIGNIRVRCTGTIGGNLAFAEPRSDLATVLLALHARVRLRSAEGSRELSMVEFMLGAYENDLREGELIVEVVVPYGAMQRGAYRKIVFSERPVVGVALTRSVDRGWRLVVGAVGLEWVTHDVTDPSEIDPAAIAESIESTHDLGGSEAYKQHLTSVVIGRCRRAVVTDQEQAR